MGEYFAIRQPDSGLSIAYPQESCVSSLNINPTNIDPFRAATSINTNSVRLLDKQNKVSELFGSNPQIFQNELLEIWLGRSNEDMDFSDYLKLTDTYVYKVSKQDNAYTFSTREAKDRLSTGAFNDQAKLAVDILAATTTITLQDTTGLATSGLFKLNEEFISYTGIAGNNLTGCVRGEQGSTPADHEAGDDIYIAEVVQDNPITLLLQCLISSGGGGVYDVLPDGAGIDQTLIDIDEFEQIRDDLFPTEQIKLIFFKIESFRKTIEEEILFPFGLRLRSNNNSKIGLAVLNRATLNIDAPDLDHDQITKLPSYDVDDTKIYNRLKIEWEYFEPTGKYLKLSEYTDATSITQFGERPAFTMKFKGIKDALDGQEIVDDIAALFFSRFAFPKPLIGVTTHMSASGWLMAEKPFVETTFIPNSSGELNFGETLEIIQKAINYTTGDVRYQLAFTAFTGMRLCYLAPSDTIVTVNSQSSIDVGAGRGDNYRVGWVMRLYDNVARDHDGTEENTIASISGDTITFTAPWATTLTTDHRIMFADYNSVTSQQKKFCFTSNLNNNFADGTPPYQITFG